MSDQLAPSPSPAAAEDRPRGPLVWLDLDQKALDDAYDQAVYAPNRRQIHDRRVTNNAVVRARIGAPERLAYGTAEIEGLDLYRTDRPGAPVVVFVHGGSWKGGRSSQALSMAEPFIKAGAHFLAADFNNVLETGGNLMPMVEQLRRAMVWVYRNAESFGGDPGKLYLIGHSSGAHLSGCLVTTDWSAYGVPQDFIRGAMLGSGMFDLKAVRLSKRSKFVAFTDEIEQELSPQRHLDRLQTPLVITYGSLETPEFQRQSREFHEALVAAGKPAQLVLGEGYNHYETQETLSNPYGFMGYPALEMMGLAK